MEHSAEADGHDARRDQRRPGRRGRAPGVTAELVAQGVRARMAEGSTRCRQVEIVLEELAAVRRCMSRANPGDLVILCADKHATVLGELENLTHQAQAG
ncbi:MAG: hypothetical protein ACYDDU_22330, partial [Dermatophilaceae bacterium]